MKWADLLLCCLQEVSHNESHVIPFPHELMQFLNIYQYAFISKLYKLSMLYSDVQGPTRPKNPSFGLALLGSGLAKQ